MIEISTQTLTPHETSVGLPGVNAPLHELALDAPVLADTKPKLSQVGCPFSNDDAARYFEQTQARTLTPEYIEANNRTALLVGESALASAIRFIPEDTIILLDSSREMCIYMGAYVKNLREASSIQDWAKRMGLAPNRLTARLKSPVFDHYYRKLTAQIITWERDGFSHAFSDEATFKEAQELARQKAIIPWHANITNGYDMSDLSEALNKHGASITMMNLTNVLPYDETFRDSSSYAAMLSELPVTPNAPILTTSVFPQLDEFLNGSLVENAQLRIVPTTGPFFGLANLAEAGGCRDDVDWGSIAVRNVVLSKLGTPKQRMVEKVAQMVLNGHIAGDPNPPSFEEAMVAVQAAEE
jgi:hypothetical protein